MKGIGLPQRMDFWFWPRLMLVLMFSVIGVYLAYEGTIDLIVAKRQQIAAATITAHDVRSRHHKDLYVFALGGNSYTGWLHPNGTTFDIGSRVFIKYDPSNPARNSLNDFFEEGIQRLALGLLMLGGVLYSSKARFGNKYRT